MKTLNTLLAWSVWARSPATRRPRSSLRRAGRLTLLALECLEGRLAPATLTVNSTADTASPNDPY